MMIAGSLLTMSPNRDFLPFGAVLCLAGFIAFCIAWKRPSDT